MCMAYIGKFRRAHALLTKSSWLLALQEQQSQFEAAVMFLDSVVTQVSAAHLADLKPGTSPADKAGILRELQALLQQVRCSALWRAQSIEITIVYQDSCKSFEMLCSGYHHSR